MTIKSMRRFRAVENPLSILFYIYLRITYQDAYAFGFFLYKETGKKKDFLSEKTFFIF